MPIDFQHATLSNGLEIIAEVDPAAHTAAMGFFVKTGARDETAALMGVSHFLEHMIFKGTARRSAEEVDRGFDDLGADHNAFTTNEMTAFYTHCLPEYLNDAEDVLSDILRPALRSADFDLEKPVILEEIAMYADVPFWALYEKAMEAYYGGHALGHRVLGTTETIEAMSRDAMQAYFDQRYAADNTVVALAGKVDFRQVVDRIGEHCGHWATTNVSRANAYVHGIDADFTINSDKVNRHYLLMLGAGPAMQDDLRYPASMLAQILGDVDGSRLYWSLVETGLAEEAQADYSPLDGTGNTLVYACCSPENATAVEETIQRELAGVVDSVTDDDLERARSKIATAATLHGELPGGRMRRLGRQWIYTGVYQSLEEELAAIDRVTIADLKSYAERYPPTATKVTGRLTPG